MKILACVVVSNSKYRSYNKTSLESNMRHGSGKGQKKKVKEEEKMKLTVDWIEENKYFFLEKKKVKKQNLRKRAVKGHIE